MIPNTIIDMNLTGASGLGYLLPLYNVHIPGLSREDAVANGKGPDL